MKPENAFKQFDKLTTDRQRWQWLIKHNTEDYMVYLDNDDTYIVFGDSEAEGDMFVTFDGYIGDKKGTCSLLSALNIKHTGV